jgi:hypothetical protein
VVALALQFGFFALFAFVGYGACVALVPERNSLRNALLAPTLGAALFTLASVLLNHLGLPVGSFAWPLTLAFALAAAAALWWRKPQVPWRKLAPFAALLVLGTLVTCRPSLEFGFDWISYSNEDMTGYCSTAQRLVDYGYYTLPPADKIAAGHDLNPESTWFLDVVGNERVGVDSLFALVVALTKLNPFNAFMPFIGIAYFMLILATASLGISRSYKPRLAFFIGLGLTLSSLTTLGVMYQLLGQVYGLAGLAAAIALLGEQRAGPLRRNPGGQLALRALVFSFLVAAYPELFPFVVLAAIASYVAFPLFERRRPENLGALFATLASVLAFALLGNYGVTMAHLIADRFHSATSAGHELLFPYFLLPSGVANLWGLITLADYPRDPLASLAIATGFVLTAGLAVAAVLAARRVHPAAFVALLMLLMGLAFFRTRADFALFKLAMYAQPFFIAALGLGAYELFRRRALRPPRRELAAGLVVALVALLGVKAQFDYVELSRSRPAAGTYRFSQIPEASPLHLLSSLREAARRTKGQPVASDVMTPEYSKFQTLYLEHGPFGFLSDDFLNYFRVDVPVYGAPNEGKVRTEARREIADFRRREPLAGFDLGARDAALRPNEFRVPWLPSAGAGHPSWLLSLGPASSILNRTGAAAQPDSLLVLQPWADVRDHLVFLQSRNFGVSGWSGTWRALGRPEPTFYRPEPDFFNPGHTIEGLGRHLLFEVVKPQPPVRLIMWITATLKGDGVNCIPPGTVLAARDVPLGGIGRGSARLISPPFIPRTVAGRSIFGVDLGVDGSKFDKRFTGLMRLYGSDIEIDPRRLVAFGRDISLVSDATYKTWNAPGWIVDVPAALHDPHLGYSGLYEDGGWSSQDAELTMQSTSATRRVRIEGMVPQIGTASGFTTVASLSVDGKPLTAAKLGIGPFSLESAVALAPGKHAIRLHFSQTQRFPAPDDRLVAARIDAAGFPP